ncbi:cell division protein FtsQ/DivIB [Enterococcus timonensis]|uniref:cell division protein FtsQ/DivIB n=1 Tax=Enterococcus timonensis TaxID=1852364 RepID=UPI0008DB26E6|nr:cell division protein FtsQ/DivIB [Enterococcus timonensis]
MSDDFVYADHHPQKKAPPNADLPEGQSEKQNIDQNNTGQNNPTENNLDENKVSEKNSTEKSNVPTHEKKNIKKDQKEKTWQPAIISNDPNQPLPKKNSFADQLPNMHKVRKNRLTGRLILLISTFLLVILLTLYFLSPLSKLEKITIEGNQQVSNQEILQQTNFALDKGLWGQVFSSDQQAEAILLNIPQVKEAKVTYQPLNSLEITVAEFATSGLLLKDQAYYPILENGVVLTEKAVPVQSGLPILENFSQTDLILQTLNQYKELVDSVKVNISEIYYSGTSENVKQITLTMNDGHKVIAQISDLAQKMEKYPQIVGNLTEPSIIDLEAGIFSYPQSQEATENSTVDSTDASTEK